jgi:NADH dehydrogenase
MGAVAGLGLWVGAFQWRNVGITGWPAWIMHRGYHGLAIPMWERKLRVFSAWVGHFFLGRDMVSLSAREQPQAYFQKFASRPKA